MKATILLPLLILLAYQDPANCAPSGPGGMQVSLSQLKARLAAETPARSISQATATEIERLNPSEGAMWENLFNGEYVARVGTTTFIIDMTPVTLVAFGLVFTVLFFFTPWGLALFRGRLHAAAGAFLSGTGIAPDFGRQLRRLPNTWLARYGTARRAFAGYMREDFIPSYKNNVTAIAFIGTAFLIAVIGLRGIKFMVPHQPDLILIAIMVEVAVLTLLGTVTWYERQAEAEKVKTIAVTQKDLSYDEVVRQVEHMLTDLRESKEREEGLRNAA